MMKIEFDEENGIAVFEPGERLTESDFKAAVTMIDPYIERAGQLNGLVIATDEFPGWESFAALLSHLSFVRDHHKVISKVAFVTDSPIGNLAEHVAQHFVSAEVKAFKYNDLEAARSWIADS